MSELYCGDCIQWMRNNIGKRIDFTLTDIPYNAVSRGDNGLRNLEKGCADTATFDIANFLNHVYEITNGTIVIFCGKEQLSEIYHYFDIKAKQHKGTVRQIVWQKSNPSPMNGEYVYLSGVENAVWFKKRAGGVFNARCKNTVFKYPCGRSKLHPTEKNHELLKELIRDNSNAGDVVFDPCAGSGSTLLCAKELNRDYIGCEIEQTWFDLCKSRLE